MCACWVNVARQDQILLVDAVLPMNSADSMSLQRPSDQSMIGIASPASFPVAQTKTAVSAGSTRSAGG